ncbi:MAG TPA: glycosyltransferase family 4 protein [Candidatus Saccharimonadales bacterium]|nr:glycosyltransferase family 4 protein [Candidatus Saccharimonadales bacterium]
MPKLKIGLVLDTSLDPPDGVQQYVIGVGEWLRSQGHDVHYLVGQTEHRKLPNVHSLARNMTVWFNGNKTTIPLPTSKRKLRKLLHKEKFDILHVQTPHSPFMAQPLIRSAEKDTAVIGTFHIAAYNRLVTAGNWLLGWWLYPSLKRFDKMLSVSTAAQSFAKKTFRINSTVIPNVFDYQLYHEAKPFKRYGDDTLTILFFGRLVARKGCFVLMQAIALLNDRKDIPKFRVIICGKGAEGAKLKKFIDDKDLADLVEMTGFVDEADKPSYYASADISVFPSSGGESFGIVLLEAMASGRAAVLGGDNPGYRSVLAPREELLFDPQDITGLADKLELYLRDTKLRKDAAAWGAAYSEQFDVNVVGQKLLAVYEEALRKRRQG